MVAPGVSQQNRFEAILPSRGKWPQIELRQWTGKWNTHLFPIVRGQRHLELTSRVEIVRIQRCKEEE